MIKICVMATYMCEVQANGTASCYREKQQAQERRSSPDKSIFIMMHVIMLMLWNVCIWKFLTILFSTTWTWHVCTYAHCFAKNKINRKCQSQCIGHGFSADSSIKLNIKWTLHVIIVGISQSTLRVHALIGSNCHPYMYRPDELIRI